MAINDTATPTVNVTATDVKYGINGSVDYNSSDVYTYWVTEMYPEITRFQPVPLPAEVFIYNYVGPFVILTGIIGNAICCIALRKQPLSNFSTSVYLFAYALSALITLIFSIGMEWINDTFELTHFKHKAETLCRIWEFLFRLYAFSGVWFIMGSGIDRFIALWFPLKSQEMCTVFIAKSSIAFTLTGITVVNVHAIWIYSLSEFHQCYLDSVTYYTWSWLSMMIHGLVPQVLVFFFGNLLIVRMCLKHRGRQIPASACVEIDLTYTVMVLSVVYFLFSIPLTVVTLVGATNPDLYHDPVSFQQMQNAYYFTSYLKWICYSCLFFVLLGCSRNFREVLKTMWVECIQFFRIGSAHVEMAMLSENYDQVPSLSTSL